MMLFLFCMLLNIQYLPNYLLLPHGLHRVAITPKGQNYDIYNFYSWFSFLQLFFRLTYFPHDVIPISSRYIYLILCRMLRIGYYRSARACVQVSNAYISARTRGSTATFTVKVFRDGFSVLVCYFNSSCL